MVILKYSDTHQLWKVKWNETRNITKQTCNTVVTESGIFKFASINFSNAKTLLQSLPKKSTFVLILVLYLYKFFSLLETQWFHKCNYKREEKNHSTSPTLFSKSARCLSLRDSVHMIHLFTKLRYKLWRLRLTARRSEVIPPLLLYFQKVSGVCLCAIRCIWYICSQTEIQAVKAPLDSWEERSHSISPPLFSKGVRCLSSHGFGVHDTFVHKLGYKLWRLCLTAGLDKVTFSG